MSTATARFVRRRRTHSHAAFAVPQKSSRRCRALRRRSFAKVSSTKSISASTHCTACW